MKQPSLFGPRPCVTTPGTGWPSCPYAANANGDKTIIEAYEYRSDCFTYDETEGIWTRHRPAKNRTYIVEATDPGVDGPDDPGTDTERYNRYRQARFQNLDWVEILAP